MHMREVMVVQRSWSKNINFNMNILITGARSFIGRNLNRMFFEENEHNVFAMSHKDLDMTNQEAVRHFFDRHNIDVVIHCAIKGGKRGVEDTYRDFVDNLAMFNNLLENKNKYGRLINFCSGAAFDRRYDINNMWHRELYERMPIDYYGLSKNIIAKEIVKHEKIINMRLYGCFGEDEGEQRFIKRSIKKSLREESIVIDRIKFMDFFHINDVFEVVRYHIENNINEREMDLVYRSNELSSLLGIALKIKDLTGSDKDVIELNEEWGPRYYGNCKILKRLGIKIKGFDYWLKREVEIARQKSTDS
jgi:UDP-glucose 4-epimerase